ncbi:MAG: sterol desaturase family protein [Alphaproteobacteria bacterium]|nr:sterol desaturase family protein [Alphaproteobacteria bacterium]
MDYNLQHLFSDLGIFVIEILLVGAVFYMIEKMRPAEEVTFFKPGFREELGLAFLNVSLFSPISIVVMAFFVMNVIQDIIPYQMFSSQIEALPITIQIVFGLFILDFSTYWRHRFTHHFMWPFHSVHHAATNLTWLTALRLHPIDIFTATVFDVLMLHLLGFSGVGLLGAVFILKGYNYFTHANINLKFDKPLRYVLASPHYHRWHHAGEKHAYNKNYCAMFSLIDLMFGTYYHPERLPKGYGLEPLEQKDYPDGLLGWLAYPFKQVAKNFKTKKEA